MAAYIPSLRKLPVNQLKTIVREELAIPREVLYPKERRIEWIATHADSALLEHLEDAVRERAVEQRRRKGVRTEERVERRQRARVEEEASHAIQAADLEHYLDLPTPAQLQHCYAQLYDATSNEALAIGVCAVCAREVDVKRDRLRPVPLDELPAERLAPTRPHPSQVLTTGMLLEPSAVISHGGEPAEARVCGQCRDFLSNTHPYPPPLSLANDLWVGPVPWELDCLTMPEQQLIALLYPRVWVFKLYPRDRSSRPSEECLQRAMRGNVSTYPMDTSGVASMVDGTLMPRPLAVLSSVIAITFIGRGKLPKRCLKSSFRVRREAVRRALLWLKANNPKYYGDIGINVGRLNALPEDDVPEEIVSMVRQSDDVGLVDQESAGYVPEDIIDDDADRDHGA